MVPPTTWKLPVSVPSAFVPPFIMVEEEVFPKGPWVCDICKIDNAVINLFCEMCKAPFSTSVPGKAMTQKRDKIAAERQRKLAAEAEAEAERKRIAAAEAEAERQRKLAVGTEDERR